MSCRLAPAVLAQGAAGTAAARPGFEARLVAELPGYDGPSSFNARPALVALSPDGRTLALSGADRTVKLFEAETGRPIATLAGEKLGFNGFAFSPDSRVAATRDTLDRSVSLWDAATGKLLRELPGRKPDVETKLKAALVTSPDFFRVWFSPDGRAVATEREDDVLNLWDAATGKLLVALEHRTETNAAKDALAFPFTGSFPLILSAIFSPDGARVVTANGDRAPKLWDAASGRLVAALSGSYDRTYYAYFVAGGRTILTFSIKGETNLWDASTGQHRLALTEARGRTYGVVASPDGRRIAAQVDDRTTVWDASDGRLLMHVPKNKGRLVIFSHDGRTLATAGGDGRAAAKLWDVETGLLRVELPKPDGDLRYVEFSPDGRLLLTTTDKGVRLWDAATGAPLATLPRARYPAHFSADGRRLAAGGTGKTALLYELSR
jgi:WD40 repeat protein